MGYIGLERTFTRPDVKPRDGQTAGWRCDDSGGHFIAAKSMILQNVTQALKIASPCGRSGDRAAAFGLDAARGEYSE